MFQIFERKNVLFRDIFLETLKVPMHLQIMAMDMKEVMDILTTMTIMGEE